MSVLNASQIRWQSAALHALLVAESETRPWLENKAAVALIREVEGCTSQAAVGALKEEDWPVTSGSEERRSARQRKSDQSSEPRLHESLDADEQRGDR